MNHMQSPKGQLAGCLITAFAVLFGLVVVAPAATFVVEASDSGFINEIGRTSKNDGVVLGATPATFNYSLGAIDDIPPYVAMPPSSDVPRRNFFTFDTSAIPATEIIVSATLELFNPIGGYSSPDVSEIFVLSGTALPDPASMASFASDLLMVYDLSVPAEMAAAMALYAKLTDLIDLSAPAFAATSVSASDDGTTLMIPLSMPGVGYLEMFKGGSTVLSGRLASLDGIDAGDGSTLGSGDEVMFGSTAPYIDNGTIPDGSIFAPTMIPTLVIETVTIPEPSRALFLALGLLPALLRRRR